MRSDTEIKSDFDFVMSEFVRFARMSWDELRPHLAEHWLHDLTDAEGRKRRIGRHASQRLFTLAEEALAESSYAGRVDPERAYRAIKDGFGKEYLRKSAEVPTGSQLRERLLAWVADAGVDCLPRTHFIPCNIGLGKDTVARLGPVTIKPRGQLWKDLSDAFVRYVEVDEAKKAESRKKDLEIAEDYYSAFKDVAAVTVPSCDDPTSRAVALSTVQGALDFIHVTAGASYTRKMVGSGPAIRDRRGEILIGPTGDMTIAWSVTWGGASLGEDLWSSLESSRGETWCKAVGDALQAVVERRQPPLLADRFLDSCSWYGDAAREPSDGAAIVKYLTAMERLLWAGEKGPGVTKRIADRAAALCFTIDNWNLEELSIQVKTAYGLRSGILHGRITKTDPEVRRGRRLCEEVSRDLLQTWLDRYGTGFSKEVTVERLREHLDGFVEAARDDCLKQKTPSAVATASKPDPG